jgi:hypothetical protein
MGESIFNGGLLSKRRPREMVHSETTNDALGNDTDYDSPSLARQRASSNPERWSSTGNSHSRLNEARDPDPLIQAAAAISDPATGTIQK